MTVANGTANGRSRKSLSAQIDRLDGILDGLADALNDAVSEAVKAAVAVSVRETVKSVLTEMLSNPELLALLRPAPTPVPAPLPVVSAKSTGGERIARLWGHVRNGLATLAIACWGVFSYVRQETTTLYRRGRERLMTAWRCRTVLKQFRTQLLASLGVGVTLGVLAWFAGPWLASLSSMAGGFSTTLAVQGGLWLRRMMTPQERMA